MGRYGRKVRKSPPISLLLFVFINRNQGPGLSYVVVNKRETRDKDCECLGRSNLGGMLKN
jgi:hypothetical protein